MNKKLIASLSLTALLALPILASAVVVPGTPAGGLTTIPQLIDPVLNIMWQIFIFIFFVMLLVAAFMFLTAQGEPEGVKKARDMLIWSAVAFAVAILAFSIPRILAALFPPGA